MTTHPLAQRRPLDDFLSLTLISERYGYVYFSTAKVAHSTIKWILLEEEYLGTAHKVVEIRSATAQPPLTGPHTLPAGTSFTQVVEDSFTFAFVRDPFTRLLSCYLDRIQEEGSFTRYQYAEALNRLPLPKSPEGFAEFVALVASQDDKAMNQHWRPQVCDLVPHLVKYDAIGRFETLREDAIEILVTIRGEDRREVFTEKLTHARGPKASGASDLLDTYYTPELRQIVRHLYAEDFAFFGYALDGSGASEPLDPAQVYETARRVTTPTERLVAEKRGKVIVAMPTIPGREAYAALVLEAILPQLDYENGDRFVLCANGGPKVRIDPEHANKVTVVPDWGTPGDMGHYRGPLVRWEVPLMFEEADYFLTVDDDIAYPANYVARTVAAIAECTWPVSWLIRWWPSTDGETQLPYKERCTFHINKATNVWLRSTYAGCGVMGLPWEDARRVAESLSDPRAPAFERCDDLWVSSVLGTIWRPPSAEEWLRVQRPHPIRTLYTDADEDGFAGREALVTLLWEDGWRQSPCDVLWEGEILKMDVVKEQSSYHPKNYWSARHEQCVGKADAALKHDGATLVNGENDPDGAQGKAVAARIADCIKENSPTSMLDVGCAAARLSASVMALLDSTERPAQWTGIDLSDAALSEAEERLAPYLTPVTHATDGGWPAAVGMHDLSLCIDVLFHAPTVEAHDALVDSVLANTRKTAIFLTWKPTMATVEGLAAHNHYYPFEVPAGWSCKSFDLPTHEGSVLHVLDRMHPPEKVRGGRQRNGRGFTLSSSSDGPAPLPQPIAPDQPQR